MFVLSDFRYKHHVNKTTQQSSYFLDYLTRKWDEIHEKSDVFRYKVDKLQEKVVDGYLLQLNPDRCTKRRQPELIDNILQPFDKDKFNFTKVSPKEILFTLKRAEEDVDVHSMLVNVSPISKYHCLVCPSVNKCLPQVVTEESLELVLDLMFTAQHRALRIGFNSLCGLASVNHLHYHIFMAEQVLPVEIAKCDHIKGPVYCLNKEYPVPAFCFEVAENASKATSKEIYRLIEHLLKRSIAHNIFITMGDSVSGKGESVLRFLVWPRKSTAGVKQLSAFNVAVLELSGWFPVFNADDFENLQREDLERELCKWKIDSFENLCEEIKKLY